MDKTIILDTEAPVEFKSVEGWVSKDGIFFGKDERAARYHASTHSLCKCGKIKDKQYVWCEECRERNRVESYWNLPFEIWDYKKPICTYDGEHYFFEESELIDYIEENPDVNPLLVIAKPNYPATIDASYWEDQMCEDGEFPEEIAKKVVEFNKFLEKQPPLSYSPSNIRTAYIKKQQPQTH